MQYPKWFKFSLYRSEFCQHIQDLKKKVLEGLNLNLDGI